MSTPPPLNGTKTHPLTHHALSELRLIVAHPVPSQDVNPGVVNRLLREALVECVQLPSPFKSHKGRLIEHLKATEAGRLRAHGGLTPKQAASLDAEIDAASGVPESGNQTFSRSDADGASPLLPGADGAPGAVDHHPV